MNIFSAKNQGAILAYNRGYRINDLGELISPKGTRIKGSVSDSGYLYARIRKGSKFYSVFFHKLCIYQKYGEIGFGAECIRHLNGIPNDNRPSNVEIGSLSENAMDIPKQKRIQIAKIASSYIVKWSKDVIDEIKNYYNKCHSYKKVMERFGIDSKGTLHYILNKR